jgi:hypothetical protein
MFKLEEICEELSQIQIPMRAEELESIGVHVEESGLSACAETCLFERLSAVNKLFSPRLRVSRYRFPLLAASTVEPVPCNSSGIKSQSASYRRSPDPRGHRRPI